MLADKDEQAHRNIGDPSSFMGVYDIEDEEEITRDAIAAGERAERFDARLTPASSDGEDLLALFLGTKHSEDEPPTETPDLPPAPMSLFESDVAYCETALHRLREKDRALRFETDVTGSVLTLDAPDDLRRRFGYFPREVFPENGRFALTADRNRMRDAIGYSRCDETAWPTLHYLWRLNPVVGWLNDRMLAAFGRHEAPVLAGVPNLAADETVFVLSGLVPNRRSHPLLYEWIAVAYRRGALRSRRTAPGAARPHRARAQGDREPGPHLGHRRPSTPAAGRGGEGPRVGRAAPARLRGTHQREAEPRAGGAGEAEDPPASPARAAARTVGPVGQVQARPGGARAGATSRRSSTSTWSGSRRR